MRQYDVVVLALIAGPDYRH